MAGEVHIDWGMLITATCISLHLLAMVMRDNAMLTENKIMTRTTKCRLFALVSIFTLLLAMIFQVLDLKVSSSFQIAYKTLFNIAIIIALIVIGYIALSGEICKICGIVLLAAYICIFAFFGVRSLYTYSHTDGARNWFVKSNQKLIQRVGTELLSYESERRHFPNSKNWCDIVLEREKDTNDWSFKIGHRHNKCSFAFNSNLNELPIDGLDANTVLLFETDGPWNFAAGPEQFPGSRYRDDYFPRKERFAFIFLADGSLIKYRLHDGAIAVFNKKEGVFGKFIVKGDPCYIRLIWKN
jgi:hypothetical protein